MYSICTALPCFIRIHFHFKYYLRNWHSLSHTHSTNFRNRIHRPNARPAGLATTVYPWNHHSPRLPLSALKYQHTMWRVKTIWLEFICRTKQCALIHSCANTRMPIWELMKRSQTLTSRSKLVLLSFLTLVTKKRMGTPLLQNIIFPKLSLF